MRVNIVGSSGSGKTTFGRQLADVLGAPFIEMDALFWKPDWTAPPDEEFFPILEEALKGDSWVLDGNYSRTTPIKWKRVQAVVWMNFSFPRVLYQSISRAAGRLISRQELWPETGNRETLRALLSRESIVLYAITSYNRKNNRIQRAMNSQGYPQIKFHRLRSPSQAQVFLDRVQGNPEILIANSDSNG